MSESTRLVKRQIESLNEFAERADELVEELDKNIMGVVNDIDGINDLIDSVPDDEKDDLKESLREAARYINVIIMRYRDSDIVKRDITIDVDQL